MVSVTSGKYGDRFIMRKMRYHNENVYGRLIMVKILKNTVR